MKTAKNPDTGAPLSSSFFWTIKVGFFLALCLLAATASLHAQAKGKRLILKDGSYQIAREWQVKGDRVRFFSNERYDWEEIPSSLVDWLATNKYEKDREAGSLEEQKQSTAQEEADRAEEEAASPTVAPGLRLPDQGGIFLFEESAGKPQLVELVQNGTDINKHMGKNILRSVINPLPTGPRQTVELKGSRARVQSHTESPAIYVDINFDSDSDSDATSARSSDADDKNDVPLIDRFKIVRLQQKDDVRVVSNLKIALTGHMKEHRDLVDTISSAVSKDWLKLVPAQPLEPGEYALIEMLNAKQMNLYVWDFGVDPNAPANATAWKPAPVKPLPTGTDDSPILHPPPKK
jgi:hypothetical protein